MFWSIVLPFKITFWCIAGLITLATIAAPRIKCKRLPAFLGATLLGVLAFVPSCTAVMHVIDARRFGVFEYATFDDVDDFRVERYLPPTARAITLDKQAGGFRARFKITETELSSYLDELWENGGDRSVVKREEMSAMAVVDPKSHEHQFGDLGWPHLEDATEYHSPTAGNGAGCSIWFSPSEGIVYQRAGYW
jgi:hypothetical protein